MTEQIDFLIDAYKSRIEFFSSHANRMWMRFHILLTVELAIAAVFLDALIKNSSYSLSILTLPCLGFFVSILWFILAAQDRCAYLGYREQISSFEDIITEKIEITGFPKFNSSGTQIRDWLTWRDNRISLSKLVAIFPVLFGILWFLLGLIWIFCFL